MKIQNVKKTITVVNMIGCPRCGGDHLDIKPIRLAVSKAAVDQPTHFIFCGNTDNPVMLWLEEGTVKES